MKKVLVAFILIMGTINAQWTPTNGPWEGPANCFTMYGTKVLAGTEGHYIYSSDDGGITWDKLSNVGLTNSMVRSILVKGTNIFAGTNGGGIYLSTNGGVHWFNVNNGLVSSEIKKLILYGDRIYACTMGGLQYSTDDGINWHHLGYGYPNTNIRDLIQLGGYMFIATDGGVYKSSDNGSNWTAANFGLISQNVYALSSIGSVLYAGTDPSAGADGLYRTTNYGASWTLSGLTNRAVYSLSVNTPWMYAATSSGMYRSSDNGVNWTYASETAGISFKHVFPVGADLLSASDDGIWFSSDAGASWMRKGYLNRYVWSMCSQGSKIWATAYRDVYLSKDNGVSWVKRTSDLDPAYRYSGLDATESEVYVSYMNNDLSRTGIYTSTNEGLSWNFRDGFIDRSISSFEAPNNSILLIGLYFERNHYSFEYHSSTMYRSSLVNTSVSDILTVDSIIFAATTDGLFRSSDKTYTWENLGIDTWYLDYTGGYLYAAGSAGISVSTDLGTTWNNLGHQGKFILSLAASSGLIAAGIYQEGILVSADNGLSWSYKNEGFDSIPYSINNLLIKDGYLFASIDGNSVWKRSILDITASPLDEPEVTISGYELGQNYPNPFNSATRIRYTVPAASFVSLKIYNMLGSECASLVNEAKDAGIYETSFDAELLSSGVYFYKLSANGTAITKKMVHLK